MDICSRKTSTVFRHSFNSRSAYALLVQKIGRLHALEVKLLGHAAFLMSCSLKFSYSGMHLGSHTQCFSSSLVAVRRKSGVTFG